MKKLIILFIGIFFAFCNLTASADVLHGSVVEIIDQSLPQEIYTGEFKEIKEKDIIELTVDKVIDTNFSIEGDEFFAKVTNDVGKNGVMIPKGTIAHGKIIQTSEAKRLGRNGTMALEFDYLITPDGRKIPIKGEMNTKLNPVKEFGKIVATDIGYTTVGGVVGGWYALNLLGIESAIASQGYTIAGGVAIGSVVGLTKSLLRKGKNVFIAPGDQIKVRLENPITLPVYRDEALLQEELNYEGFKVEITNVEYEKDPFGEPNTITLTLKIENLSDKVFSGMDITLNNEYGQVFYPSVFGNTNLMFEQIKVGDRLIAKISFSVHDVKGTYWLSFKDRLTKKELVKTSIDNAYKGVSHRVKRKNERIRKKKANLYRSRDID
ncbi:hypothetical protein IKJ53_00755 [bacterium]|nr:hypothetical protein [bacterium]